MASLRGRGLRGEPERRHIGQREECPYPCGFTVAGSDREHQRAEDFHRYRDPEGLRPVAL
jgi:hypothetical protein